MSYQRRYLKKSFGRYKAIDVDDCLAELEHLLSERDERIMSLDQQLRYTRQELETAGTQRDEAVKARDTMAETYEAGMREVEDARREVEDARRELNEERSASRAIHEENETLNTQCRALAEDTRTQAQQLLRLKTDLDRMKRQLDTAQDELTLSRVQAEHLGQRVADQRREIERTEQLLMNDPVGEANRRAEKIMQDAMAASQKMMDDAEAMRAQALAAVRAAYFNAMGFRQTIEERFTNLEHELDRSMGSLRALQLPDQGNSVDYLEDQRGHV